MVRMPKDLGKKTRTIHDPTWDPSETVTIKTYLGDYDRRRILSAASEYRQDEGGKTIIVGTLEKLYLTKRLVSIVSWTLQDEDGQPLPFTEDYIKNLPPDVAQFIDQEVDKELGAAQAYPSKEAAQAAEKEEQQDRITFHRPAPGDVHGQQDIVGHHDGKGTSPGGRRRAAAAPAQVD